MTVARDGLRPAAEIDVQTFEPQGRALAHGLDEFAQPRRAGFGGVKEPRGERDGIGAEDGAGRLVEIDNAERIAFGGEDRRAGGFERSKGGISRDPAGRQDAPLDPCP